VPNVDLKSVVTFEDGELIRGNITATNLTGRNTNLNAMQKVQIPILSEVDLFATQNTQSITAGTRVDGTIDGASQNVNYRDVKDTNGQQTINLAGLGANATVSAGDTFEVANVLAVNNRSRQPFAYPKQFTVLTAATADGTGDVTVTISPAIIVGGTSDGVSAADDTLVNTAFQTVNSIPADAAVVTWTTVAGAVTPIRVAFHKRAISLVSARLRTPFSDTSSFISDPETGIGIRYWRGSDITTGRHIHRWDTVFGVQMVQPELGSRVNGS